jgi:hypothetical protein
MQVHQNIYGSASKATSIPDVKKIHPNDNGKKIFHPIRIN